LNIVKNNPKSLKVHFGGKRGREIRNNYLTLTIHTVQPDGSTVLEPILGDLDENTVSYTFSEPRGLLFSTQFAQPAITLVAKAAFEDMRSKGLVTPGSTFAGHSLGEYGALSAFTDFIPFQTLMSVVFYRGLTMQVAMDRDEYGSTDFGMVAINPGRIGKCE
jgi:fatty acid synthase subunit beta